MGKNLFIALEGTDGSGKSTQTKLLAERLQAEGHKVHQTFEPTDGHIGKLLRSILKGQITADQTAIAAMFLADRLDHLTHPTEGLLRKLEEGYTVITDRYYFSSYAYHSVYVDMEWVIACNKACADMLRPTATLYIDVPPAICMQRIEAAREGTELYERADLLEKIHANYLAAFDRLAAEETVYRIDGNRPVADVANDVWARVRGLL
jgi:dTMP kinase